MLLLLDVAVDGVTTAALAFIAWEVPIQSRKLVRLSSDRCLQCEMADPEECDGLKFSQEALQCNM